MMELFGWFIIGASLFGLADFIKDCFDGYGFSIRGQMKRNAHRLYPHTYRKGTQPPKGAL